MELKDYHEKDFTAEIDGCKVKGVICVTPKYIYLCQDVKDGTWYKGDKYGFKYSWAIHLPGNEKQLEDQMVTNMVICDQVTSPPTIEHKTNLLHAHGKSFTAIIRGEKSTGRICVEDEKVYLCQNQVYGSAPKNKFNYLYGFTVTTGTNEDLIRYGVKDFQILNQNDCKDWQVGDNIINHSETAKVIFRSGELVVIVRNQDTPQESTRHYSCNELYNKGWRIKQ